MNVTQKKPVDKDLVKFYNSLRCPLCGSQLDGGIYNTKSELYCARDNREYKVTWYAGEQHPQTEELVYWYTQFRYNIYITKLKTVSTPSFSTVIDRFNLDLSPPHIEFSRERVFAYTGAKILFFRQRMEEDKFLNKLKTYNVFS